jgi:Chalcone isomerase-like
VSRTIAAFLLVFALAPAVSANVSLMPSLPSDLHAQNAELRILGQGRMRWFGLHLYDASLWVTGRDLQWDHPFVLDIRYARSFNGSKIAEVSAEEMLRLGFRDDRKLAAWRELMRRAFPDVKSGEHITGVFRPGAGVDFYHQGRPTAVINDAEFARAFFSIWLDPATREPKLRAALLGQR